MCILCITCMCMPREFCGQRSLSGCNLWGPQESDVTEWLALSQICMLIYTYTYSTIQVRIVEWAVIPFSRESSWRRDWTRVSLITSGFLPSEPPYILNINKNISIDICIYVSCQITLSSVEVLIFYFQLFPEYQYLLLKEFILLVDFSGGPVG